MPRLLRLAVAGALLLTSLPAFAFDAKEKEEIGQVVREYLLKNPEVMVEVQQALQKKQQDADAAKAKEKLANKPATLENSKLHAVIGNPNGDVTLVEFFDYNCGYCRRALGDVDALIAADPKLKVVLKEFPILSRGSAEAAQVSAAVGHIAPEKYKEFHDKLLGTEGQADGASALKVAKAVGIDPDALKKGMTSPDAKATIEESYALAQQFGIESTPVFIVGDAILPGAVGVDALKTRIDAVRQCGKAMC